MAFTESKPLALDDRLLRWEGALMWMLGGHLGNLQKTHRLCSTPSILSPSFADIYASGKLRAFARQLANPEADTAKGRLLSFKRKIAGFMRNFGGPAEADEDTAIL
jgi:hypothetical protein